MIDIDDKVCLMTGQNRSRFTLTNQSINIDSQILDSAILKGIEYISRNFIPNQGWVDFQTNSSGESDAWITCHIYWKLANLLPDKIRSSAKKILEGFILPDNGVGYSKITTSDCDSTLHFVNAWLYSNLPVSEIENQINYIANHQNPDGGIKTYDEVDLLSLQKTNKYANFKGWTLSHNCVTGAALETVVNWNIPSYCFKEKVLDFIKKNQNNEGGWNSYWWRSKYFATSKIVSAFAFLNINEFKLNESYSKGINYIKHNFNSKGYWDNGFEVGVPCVISTVLNSEALLNSPKSDKVFLESVVKWLLGTQEASGNWASNPILQIPPPNVIDPNTYVWDFNKVGVGSCTADQAHLYTTAHVINFLEKVKNFLK